MGVPDKIVTHGDPKLLLGQFGLDADGIYSKVIESLEKSDEKRINKTQRIKAVR